MSEGDVLWRQEKTASKASAGEIVIASVAFAAALSAFVAREPLLVSGASGPPAVAILVVLVGGFLAFSLPSVPRTLRDLVPHDLARLCLGPVVVFLTVLFYSMVAGLAVGLRAVWYGMYLALPVLALSQTPSRRNRWLVRNLVAIAVLWLPIEFGVLPALPAPVPNGYNSARLVGLVAALYLFLVARPLSGIGYHWRVKARDVGIAAIAFAVYAPFAVTLGVVTGFLHWSAHTSLTDVLATPLVVYLATALPEELLFRGLLQNVLARSFGSGIGLATASVIFGLAHLPDPRYVVLATLAGLAYGFTYQRTGKITASAITHALVDSVWVLLLHV
jgi:hypothetical protein